MRPALSLTTLALRVADYQGSWTGQLTPFGIAVVVAVFLGASLTLRGGARLRNSHVRWGWLCFAAIIMASCVAFSMASDLARSAQTPSLFMLALGSLGAALLGVILSVPLLAFLGFPIAHAQSLARRGLAGEERGERIVGIGAALATALIAVQLMVSRSYDPSLGQLLPVVPAALSILLGLAAPSVRRRLLFRGERRHGHVPDASRAPRRPSRPASATSSAESGPFARRREC